MTRFNREDRATLFGSRFVGFSAVDLIDEFLWDAPAEFHLSVPSTQLLALLIMLALSGIVVLAARVTDRPWWAVPGGDPITLGDVAPARPGDPPARAVALRVGLRAPCDQAYDHRRRSRLRASWPGGCCGAYCVDWHRPRIPGAKQGASATRNIGSRIVREAATHSHTERHAGCKTGSGVTDCSAVRSRAGFWLGQGHVLRGCVRYGCQPDGGE